MEDNRGPCTQKYFNFNLFKVPLIQFNHLRQPNRGQFANKRIERKSGLFTHKQAKDIYLFILYEIKRIGRKCTWDASKYGKIFLYQKKTKWHIAKKILDCQGPEKKTKDLWSVYGWTKLTWNLKVLRERKRWQIEKWICQQGRQGGPWIHKWS